MIKTALVGTLALTTGAFGANMDCGGAEACGVVVLESGFGPAGVYGHNFSCVHGHFASASFLRRFPTHELFPFVLGLWPEVAPYGNSACVAPYGSKANPTEVFSCYNQPNSTQADDLSVSLN